MRTVLLQDASAFCLLAGARAIRSADTVCIGRRVPLQPVSAKRLERAARWVRLLNARARVEALPLDVITRHLWQLNEEAVDPARALAPEIERSRPYRIVRRLIRDDALVRYFQAAIVRQLPNGPLLRRIADDLRAGGRTVTVVGEWHSVGATDETVMHRVARAAAALRAAVVSAAIPGAYVIVRLRHGLRRDPAIARKVALPVVRGLRTGRAAPDAASPQDDRYLYGPDFAPGDVVHVFSDWKLGPQAEAETRQVLASERWPWADRDAAGLDLRIMPLIRRAVGTAVRLLRPSWGRIDTLVLAETPKAIYTYLKKHGEYLLAPASVAIVRDDYNPGHVIATIAAHERGMRTFGLSHVATLCDGPQLAFVHVDRHAVYAPMLLAPFRALWPEGMVERIGRKSIDWVAHFENDRAAAEALRERWRAVHPAAEGPVILVLFPGAREICLPRQWDEMYQGLLRFSHSAGRVTIVLRFRNRESLSHEHVGRIARLPERDSRFVVEMSSFTTYELIAVSDFVIAPEASFTINEAAARGVPVVTFEYIGTATRYFGSYGRDFVLRTAADVERTLRVVVDGGPALDCDWARLSADANFSTDGRNRARLQRAVRRLVEGLPAADAGDRLSISA